MSQHEVVVDDFDCDGFCEEFYDVSKFKTDDVTKEAGRKTWRLLHSLADHYPCPPCKPVFQTTMSGVHDLVNVHLGKPIYDPERWRQFVDMVKDADSKTKHELD